MPTSDAPALAVPLVELHSAATGRIDAAKVAAYLRVPLPRIASAVGAAYAAAHKTPDASSLQEGLGRFKRVLALLTRATRNRREARAWLNTPHPDLDERTPIDIMLSGRADAVIALLENALAGHPS